MTKKDQETKRSGGGGLLLGLILGFGICLFIKEEERQKIIDFLTSKLDRARKEGEQLVEKKVNSDNLPRKRFFQKRN